MKFSETETDQLIQARLTNRDQIIGSKKEKVDFVDQVDHKVKLEKNTKTFNRIEKKLKHEGRWENFSQRT